MYTDFIQDFSSIAPPFKKYLQKYKKYDFRVLTTETFDALTRLKSTPYQDYHIYWILKTVNQLKAESLPLSPNLSLWITEGEGSAWYLSFG